MALPAQKLTLDEFLAWENQQPDRNEFHRGEVFAMAGGGAPMALLCSIWRAGLQTNWTAHRARCLSIR